MWVVSVMPIGKAAAHKEFSYFSLIPHREGAVAKIPARGKDVFGLIMRSTPLADMRQSVKGADFKLQKIAGESRRIFSQPLLRAAFDMADFHACSLGAIVADLAPRAVLEKFVQMPELAFESRTNMRGPEDLVRERPIIGSRENRFNGYRISAQKTLARKKSVLLIAPTVVEASRLAARFKSAGVPHALMHGELTGTRMRGAWQFCAAREEPLVIVGTPLALSAPRRDWGVIIVERAGARGFTRDERPFLSIVECARILAKKSGADLYIGSPAPLVAHCQAPVAAGAARSAALIDMRPAKDADTPRAGRFELISPSARELIASALEKKESVALLCARRGFATSTVCDDCGAAVMCERCGSLAVLRDGARGRYYACPLCGSEASAVRTCRACGSWRLTPLGIGVERVRAEAQKLFADAAFFSADETLLRNSKKTSGVFETFRTAPAALLIGTESALPHLERIPHAVVISIDSLLFIPEYSAGEQALQMLFELRGLVEHELLLQTRATEHKLMEAIAHGDPEPFLAEESRLRRQLSYPPSATLIRLTLEASSPRFPKELAALETALAEYAPQRITGRPSAGRKTSSARRREYLLIRLPQDAWPDRALLARLRALPPSIEVRVNPRAIFSG